MLACELSHDTIQIRVNAIAPGKVRDVPTSRRNVNVYLRILSFWAYHELDWLPKSESLATECIRERDEARWGKGQPPRHWARPREFATVCDYLKTHRNYSLSHSLQYIGYAKLICQRLYYRTFHGSRWWLTASSSIFCLKPKMKFEMHPTFVASITQLWSNIG